MNFAASLFEASPFETSGKISRPVIPGREKTWEALNKSSLTYQTKNKTKCDFVLFFIFNGLSAIENGGTSMCRGTSEFFRGSLATFPLPASVLFPVPAPDSQPDFHPAPALDSDLLLYPHPVRHNCHNNPYHYPHYMFNRKSILICIA